MQPFARDFSPIDSIRIDALLDEQDMGRLAAYADYERITAGSPSMPVLEIGYWRWIRADREGRRFRSMDGVLMDYGLAALFAARHHESRCGDRCALDSAAAASELGTRNSELGTLIVSWLRLLRVIAAVLGDL